VAPARQALPPAPPGLERGRYLVAAGDCMDCHTRPGGRPFAGGRPIQTPFGVLLSANITPDEATGIGGWTNAQFRRALRKGVDDEGQHLYPAFPYNYYTKVTDQDADAILAYLKALPPVSNPLHRNQLWFPFNQRWAMALWNRLFLKVGPFRPDPHRSAAWNRGAYLVEGLGHCGACHTPETLFGAPKRARAMQGGLIPSGWVAPDLTPNPRTGLGGWSRADLAEFLKTGRNAHSSATAEMGEVVNFSTAYLSDSDLDAIATYLGSLPPSPQARPSPPGKRVMAAGEAIYTDECSACHGMNGEGVSHAFPPLHGDANLQQDDPRTVVRFILTGVRAAPTASRPTAFAMPSFAWVLDDRQVAAVATYVRNAWGNRAPAVSPSKVRDVRKSHAYPRIR
jgi:mono/diheme cytochrome c family protein